MALPNLPSNNEESESDKPQQKKRSGGLPSPSGLPKMPATPSPKPTKKAEAPTKEQSPQEDNTIETNGIDFDDIDFDENENNSGYTEIEKEQIEQPTSSRKRKKRPQSPAKKKRDNTVLRNEDDTDLGDGWAIDKKTGVKYKKIPPAEYDSNGLPVSTIADEIEDPFDLNDAANKFLGHLRVAPDPKEQRKIAEQRAKMREKQNKQYQEETADIKPKK